jgi:hypothetical protein
MKCVWRTSRGACLKDDKLTRKCRSLLCPDGHQVIVVLVLTFIFIMAVMVLGAPN